MKLRIHENSIRLRLTQKEVAKLRNTERVDAAISVASDRIFSYSIEILPGAKLVSVALCDNAIRVAIPPMIAHRWTDTDEVSIRASQPINATVELQLLIEKDFQCLHRTAEEEPDAYPNPLARPECIT